MARQPKQGLDYYPMDVTFLKDRKFTQVRHEHGCVAVMVYQSLLELIYGDKGYYLVYNEACKIYVIEDILERVRGKYQPTSEKIAEIIEGLVDCELFSEYHFKREIITSKRIQSTYYSATVERKAVNIDFDIWMLSESEMSALSRRSVILHNFINRTINEDNRSINGDNRPTGTQSKVKESKVNKSKESVAPCGAAPPSIHTAKPEKRKHGEYRHVLLSDGEYGRLVAEHGIPRTEAAIKHLDEYIQMKGYKANDHNLAIRKWVFEALDERERKQRAKGKNKFNNYEGRKWDYDKLERLERERLERELKLQDLDAKP